MGISESKLVEIECIKTEDTAKSSNKLINACLKGDYLEVGIILERNSISVNYYDHGTHLYPILCAAIMKESLVLQIILSHNPNIHVYYYDMPLMNCICSIINYDCFEILDLLLDYGADIESIDRHPIKITPLMYACDTNNLKLVKYLVKKGADVNSGYNKKHDKSVLEHACIHTHDNVDMVRYLLNNGATIDPDILIQTCENSDNSEIAKMLITEYNVDVNYARVDGGTAISGAICEKHVKVIDVLIKHKAHISKNEYNVKHPWIKCVIATQSKLY